MRWAKGRGKHWCLILYIFIPSKAMWPTFLWWATHCVAYTPTREVARLHEGQAATVGNASPSLHRIAPVQPNAVHLDRFNAVPCPLRPRLAVSGSRLVDVHRGVAAAAPHVRVEVAGSNLSIPVRHTHTHAIMTSFIVQRHISEQTLLRNMHDSVRLASTNPVSTRNLVTRVSDQAPRLPRPLWIGNPPTHELRGRHAG